MAKQFAMLHLLQRECCHYKLALADTRSSICYCIPCMSKSASRFNSFCLLQVKFNVLERDPEISGLLGKCQELGVTLVAHSPLQQGILTGTFPSFVELSDVHGIM